MDSEFWKRVSSVFGEALGKDEASRRAFLDQACLGNPELRRAVDNMLEERKDPRFLGGPSEVPPPEDSEIPVEQVGEFELKRLLGHGGMASVYVAWQPSLAREVAVKILEARLTTPERDVERFHREARSVAKLHHAGIVPIYAEGRAGPFHYFAMELVHGSDLRQELSILRGEEPAQGKTGLLPAFKTSNYLREVARICRDAARALGFAHANRIVHRDVKPANIFLQRDGLRVQLGDFGLARDESQTLAFAERTQTHAWGGTLPYMSPEQTVALTNNVDGRSDLYSLGIVLYEFLTLTTPFQGSVPELIRQIRDDEPRSVRSHNPRVPVDLALVCHKAIEKAPRDRYQTADLLADDLDRFLSYEAVHVRPKTLVQRTLRWTKRHWVRVTIAVTAAFVTVIGTLLGAHYQRTTRAAELLAITRRVPAAQHLAGASTKELAEIYHATVQLAELPLSDDDARDVAAARIHLDAHCRELVASAEATVKAARADFAEGKVAALDLAAILKAQEDCRRAALISNDSSLLESVSASSMLPTLAIEASPDLGSGRAEYCQLDPITGQPNTPQPLGAIPTFTDRLPPGPLRITVRFASGDLREYTRYVSIGAMPLEIRCVPAGFARRVSPLVSFTPGVLDCPDEGLRWAPLARRSIHVAPYELEQYEVTVGQFRDFLRVTKRQTSAPLARLLDYPSVDDDIPVTCLTWEEARDYAEWLGMRLPTYAELTFATRGPAWAAWPSFDSAKGTPLGNVAEPKIAWNDILDPVERIRIHLQHVQRYNSHAGVSPQGVHHLAGNVAEWVEGPAPDLGLSGLVARSDTRLVMNGDWSVATPPSARLPHTAIESRGPGPAYAFVTHGFRCARTRK